MDDMEDREERVETESSRKSFWRVCLLVLWGSTWISSWISSSSEITWMSRLRRDELLVRPMAIKRTSDDILAAMKERDVPWMLETLSWVYFLRYK